MKTSLKMYLFGAISLLGSEMAYAASCTISHPIDSEDQAPISWNQGDNIAQVKNSTRTGSCSNVPAGSTIDSMHVHLSYEANKKHLTEGLVPGDYGIVVSAGGNSVWADWDHPPVYSTKPAVHSAGINIYTFNGVQLDGLVFSFKGDVRNVTAVPCNAADCGQFLKAWYDLTINYSAPVPPPATPSAPSASVSGRTVTLNWNAVPGADYYHRQVSINGGGWTNTRTLYGTSKTYFNYAFGSYRYRLEACNSSGCSGWSAASNQITVLEPVPASPSGFSAQVSGADTVILSWNGMAYADYYEREVSVNGGSWKNRRTLTGTNKYYFGYASGSYEYRLRSCNEQGCSSWSYSNEITVQ